MRARIATLNVWGMPWPMARDTPERMRAIGAALPALEADAVAFQEVWTAAARDVLVASAQRAGLSETWHNEATFGGSGLLVVSRLPLARVRFEPYLLRGLPHRFWHGDYWGGKGFAEVELAGPEGAFTLVTTHLHAQYTPDGSDEYFSHRMGQVVQLAARLREIDEPLVAAGDFNLREDRPEYRVLVGLAHLRDAAAALDRRQPTSLAGSPYRTAGHAPEERIDYAFSRDGTARGARPLAVRRVFDEPIRLGARSAAYSDHAGVLAEFEIAGAAGAPLRAPDPGSLAQARDALERGRADASSRRARHRAVAGVGLGATAAGIAGSRTSAFTRRDLLRTTLHGASTVALGVGIGSVFLAELHGPGELEAFDAVLRALDGLDPERG